MKAHDELPLRTFGELLRIYEDAALWSRPPGSPRIPVVAVALNTAALDERSAARAVAQAAAETGLPAADPIREGAAGGDRLARALLAAAR